MADDAAVQRVKELAGLLKPVIDTVPDEIRGVVTQSSYDYVQALRQVGAEQPEIEEYVNNSVEMARMMHSLGTKSGQLKKFLEEQNVQAIEAMAGQRDREMAEQMDKQRQHQSMVAAQTQMQQSLDRGQLG